MQDARLEVMAYSILVLGNGTGYSHAFANGLDLRHQSSNPGYSMLTVEQRADPVDRSRRECEQIPSLISRWRRARRARFSFGGPR